MLLITSQSLRGNKSISDAARELSLSLRHFDSPAALSALMTGQSRRIVVLDAADDDLRLGESRRGKGVLEDRQRDEND